MAGFSLGPASGGEAELTDDQLNSPGRQWPEKGSILVLVRHSDGDVKGRKKGSDFVNDEVRSAGDRPFQGAEGCCSCQTALTPNG